MEVKEGHLRAYCDEKQVKELMSVILSAITRERPDNIREFTLAFLQRPSIKPRPVSMRGDPKLMELAKRMREEKMVEQMVESEVAKEEDMDLLRKLQKTKSTTLFEVPTDMADTDAAPVIMLDHAPIILDE